MKMNKSKSKTDKNKSNNKRYKGVFIQRVRVRLRTRTLSLTLLLLLLLLLLLVVLPCVCHGASPNDNDGDGDGDGDYDESTPSSPSTPSTPSSSSSTASTPSSPSTPSLLSPSPTSAVLFPWFVEIVGVMVFFLLTRFELPVPYAAVMFLIGVGMGYGTLSLVNQQQQQQQQQQQHEEEEEPVSLGGVSNNNLDQLTQSVLQWSNINSGVLLLVFLPGLIFRDAIEVNFGLFYKALPQLLILAFPMVLVGTVLTAIVAHYALPYGWPLSLAATLGAILSSTDPVAVGSVLKSAGAPPRLQMQISGESLLNDGSAVVFFSIFSSMYLAEMGGQDENNDEDAMDWGQGIATFFRMALGGTAVGLAFATGLLGILYELDRRLEPQYNVLQVVAALTFAYLSYYVSEQVCNMSGVIACVVCGITARALGRGMVTDNALMDSYLALMEFLLNTLLFTLGGVVYGKVIHRNDTSLGDYSYDDISWKDFGYLLVFYILIMAIRFLQVALFYPFFSRVGLKSNWRETIFLGFGGLRGAVGVALALSLERSARESLDDSNLWEKTRQVEFFAGGVTFLTLFVNGTLAGPVLKMLKLAKPTVSRKRTLRLFKSSAENFVNNECTKLLKEPRYQRASIPALRELVPFLTLEPPQPPAAPKKVPPSQATRRRERRQRTKSFSDGVARMASLEAESSAPHQHSPTETDTAMSEPRMPLHALDDFEVDEKHKQSIRYASALQEPLDANDTNPQNLKDRRRARRARMKTLSDGVAFMATMTTTMPSIEELAAEVAAIPRPAVKSSESGGENINQEEHDDDMEDPFSRIASVSQRAGPVEALQEIRGLYLDLLRDAYGEAISNNELDEREDNGFNINLLRQSVAFAEADNDHQEPINDWEYTQNFRLFEDAKLFCSRQYQRLTGGLDAQKPNTYEYQQERATVLRAILFIEAHKLAEKKLNVFVQNAIETSMEDGDAAFLIEGAIGIVLDESKKQVLEARNVLDQFPPHHVDHIISNHVARILLRRLADFTEKRANDGFLTKKEARVYLDRIDQNIQKAHGAPCEKVDGDDNGAKKEPEDQMIASQAPTGSDFDNE